MAELSTRIWSPTSVTTKRARQACENCRRKKSKCTGEKPECSFCVRLRQKCVYARHHRMRNDRYRDSNGGERSCADVDSAPNTSDALMGSKRLRGIEDKLQQLAAVIESTRYAPSTDPSVQGLADGQSASFNTSWVPVNSRSPDSLFGGTASAQPRVTHEVQLPTLVVEDGVEIYFANYCNQPCPIAAHYKTSAVTADCIPIIVLVPMLALSLRSSCHSFFETGTGKTQQLERLSQLSWDLLAKAYSDFNIDDAYFEGSCLLAVVDSGEGRVERARAQVSLGLRIAQGRGMLTTKSFNSLEAAVRSRRQEIVWTLFMLDRMLLGGSIRDPSVPATSFELPFAFGGPSRPDLISRSGGPDALDVFLGSETTQQSHSIVQLNIEILTIWEAVLADIGQTPSDTDIPIWRHDSCRAVVLTKLLEFETRCHRGRHGYVSTGPATRVLGEPLLRDYFLAWIFYQLVHCVIQCCLNHPFIIYVKTVQNKQQIPVTFLQKSYEYSMIHANWVFRLLNEMDDAKLAIHDPFIGRLVAIAASIHLEHTLSQHASVALSAKQKFEKCLQYVERASEEWPSMFVTASLLRQLQSRLVYRPNMNYIEDEYDGAAPPSSPRQDLLGEEDMQLMWKLFDIPSNSGKKLEGDELGGEYVRGLEDGGSCSYNSDGVQEKTNLGSMEESQLPNLLAGVLADHTSSEASYGDWSLFGRSWADYMPSDFASVDSMTMGSMYQW